MSVNYINTKEMEKSAITFRDKVKEFSDIKHRVQKINNELFTNWVGKSRNSYEKQFRLLLKNMEDIEESIYEFYDSLIEAQASYMETDDELSKSFEQK